jgi:hypothetical protein
MLKNEGIMVTVSEIKRNLTDEPKVVDASRLNCNKIGSSEIFSCPSKIYLEIARITLGYYKFLDPNSTSDMKSIPLQVLDVAQMVHISDLVVVFSYEWEDQEVFSLSMPFYGNQYNKGISMVQSFHFSVTEVMAKFGIESRQELLDSLKMSGMTVLRESHK